MASCRYLRLVLQRKLEPFAQERGLDPTHLEPPVNRMDSSKELQAALIDPEGFLVDKMRSDDPAGQRLRKKTIMVTIKIKCSSRVGLRRLSWGSVVRFPLLRRWRCESTFSSAISFMFYKVRF